MEDKKDKKNEVTNVQKESISTSYTHDLFNVLYKENKPNRDIAEKVLKVTQGLFLITDTLARHEGIQVELRTKGIDFLDEALTFLQQPSIEVEQTLRLLSTKIISLLDVAVVSKQLSPMNVRLVAGAYLQLLHLFPQVFEVAVPHELSIEKDFFEESPVFPRTPSLGVFPRREQPKTITRQKSEAVRESHKTDERRAAILSFLKKKPRASVKDVIAVVPGVSEKTVQRELLALVDAGILKKEGERRWSTYSLT